MIDHLRVTLGLSKRTTSEGLRTAFAQFGEVADGIELPLYEHFLRIKAS